MARRAKPPIRQPHRNIAPQVDLPPVGRPPPTSSKAHKTPKYYLDPLEDIQKAAGLSSRLVRHESHDRSFPTRIGRDNGTKTN